jgi:hypothetical protein
LTTAAMNPNTNASTIGESRLAATKLSEVI